MPVLPDAPPLFAEVIDRALASEKEERWGSAGAMREALRSACRSSFGQVPTADFVAEVIHELGEEATVVQSFDPPPAHPGIQHGAVIPSRREATPPSEEPTQQITQWLPRVPAPARPQLPMAELATAMPVSTDTLSHPVRARRFSPRAVIAVAVGVAAIAGGGIGLGRCLDEALRQPAASPSEPSAAGTASATPATTVPEASIDEVAAAPTATVDAARASAPGPTPTARTATPPTTAKPKPSPSCVPFKTSHIDTDGRRIFDRECPP